MCVLYCSDQRSGWECDYRCVYCIVAISGEWAGRDYRCVYCIVAISGSGRDVTIDVCIVL